MAVLPPLQSALAAINGNTATNAQVIDGSPWTFSIAGFPLLGQEVPEGFDLGHEAKFAVHEYISSQGTPVIRTHFQGAYLVPTKWKAVFTKATALYRAQTLDKLMLTGQTCTFQYGPLSFTVQIKKFVYTPKWQTEVDYEIELILLEDQNGQSSPPLPQNFDAGMENLYSQGTAQFLTLYNSDPNLQTALNSTNIVAGANGVPTIQTGLLDAYGNYAATIEAAYPLRSQTFPQLFNLSQMNSGLLDALDAYIAPLASSTLRVDQSNLVQAMQVRSTFAQFGTGLQKLTGTADRKPIVLQSDSNLIAIAAQYYPKYHPVETAANIAQANGLTSFFVAAGSTLYMPPIFGTNVVTPSSAQ